MELDELHLPSGQVVYEAEIESNDSDTHARLSNWILSLVPEARLSQVNKFQRFRAALHDWEGAWRTPSKAWTEPDARSHEPGTATAL
jgi:hypothetical protein